MNVLDELLGHVLSVILDYLAQEWRRFYACLLLALATSSFILWLVPACILSIVLSIAVITTGLIGGVWWEHANR
jgi:hypothetical protein